MSPLPPPPQGNFGVDGFSRNSRRPARKNRPAEDLKINPVWKTRLCMHYEKNACRYPTHLCSFAHGIEELRPEPDFTKTSVCPIYVKYGNCTDPNCRYAHHKDELNVVPGLLKSRMCKFLNIAGGCVVGEACRFAHHVDELIEAKRLQSEAKMTSQEMYDQRRLDFMQSKTVPQQTNIAPGPQQQNIIIQAPQFQRRKQLNKVLQEQVPVVPLVRRLSNVEAIRLAMATREDTAGTAAPTFDKAAREEARPDLFEEVNKPPSVKVGRHTFLEVACEPDEAIPETGLKRSQSF